MTSPDVRIAIVIPALNEAETIVDVVNGAAQIGHPIVVDDGSSDGTGEFALAAGAVVVTHKRPGGYDAALRAGVVDAVNRGYEVIATMDGDAQHDPAALGELVAVIQDTDVEVVIGVRQHGARAAERLFNRYAAARFGVPDILCGMKGYRASVCERHATALDGKTIGTGLALAALRAGSRPALVKVPIRSRQHGTARFGGRLRANGRILRALASALWLDVRSRQKSAP